MDPNGVTARRLDGYRAAFERGWEAGLRPTGVLAMSDAMAIGAMDPPLTTVHQPIRRKGEEAVGRLLAVIGRPNGSAVPTAGHRCPPTELIIRGSSGPAPRR